MGYDFISQINKVQKRDKSCNPKFMCIGGTSMNNILKVPTGGVGAGWWSAGD